MHMYVFSLLKNFGRCNDCLLYTFAWCVFAFFGGSKSLQVSETSKVGEHGNGEVVILFCDGGNTLFRVLVNEKPADIVVMQAFFSSLLTMLLQKPRVGEKIDHYYM